MPRRNNMKQQFHFLKSFGYFSVIVLCCCSGLYFPINILTQLDNENSSTPLLENVALYELGMKWLEDYHTRPLSRRWERVMLGTTRSGFASMFQYAALQYGECVAENKGLELYGHYSFYTFNDVCKIIIEDSFNGHACFFRNLHEGPLEYGRLIDDIHVKSPNITAAIGVPVPKGLPAQMTTGKWWGILQSYMFRLNNRTAHRFAEISASMGLGLTGERRPDIGVHIRLGDKLGDAASRQGQFAGLSVESIVSVYLREVDAALAHLRTLSPASGCDQSPLPSSSSAARAVGACDGELSVYVATDSAEAAALVRAWAANRPSVTVDKVYVYVRSSTVTQLHSGKKVNFARRIGKLKYNASYAAAEEVIYDMHMLSQSRILIGLIMSQITRSAVSMSYAADRLVYAVAIDSDNVNNFRRVDPQWRAAAGSVLSSVSTTQN
jgi:hypothetical protein